MSFVPSTSREDSNHQRNQETLRPATGVMLQSHNSSVSINPTVYPSISPSVSSPTFIPPYVNNTQSSTTNSNGRILQDIEAAHNFVIGQRDTSSYASHLSSEEPMATRSRYGESYNYGRNGDEYGISEATRASSERNQLDGESMRSLAHGSSSPSAGSVGATASVSARYEEYRADIEHLARKLSSARQVSEKKDQIIQDLNERLEAVLASQRNRSTCVDAACQVDSDKSGVPALTITLRGVVQQLFQVVTGEESDNVDEYDLTQCAEIISSRIEHIVKKIERLVGFRHEVVEFFLRKVERNPSTAPEDPLAVWRKGRSRVLELLEANAALQSEIEDITQRYEQLQQQLPEPRHLNRENSIDEDERSVWTREVASSYENVRSALMLCVRHTHWHQRNPRRGDDAEYHDMCEITRRMEEIQGRLHWVVANCLDEEERGPGGLQAPCNKDELLHALENAHRAATRRTSVTRLHTNSKSPVRTRYSSGTAASRASPTNTHTPHRGMSMSTARYGSVRSPATPRHLTGLPQRTPTPTRTAVTRTHMGLAGGGDGGAYNRKSPIRGTHAVRAAPSIRTQLFKESAAGPSASRRPLASVVSNMTSRGTYMAEKESAGSYVRSGSMNTMLSSVPLNSNRRSGSTSPSRLLMIRKNGSIH